MEAMKSPKISEQELIVNFDSFFPSVEKMDQYKKMAELLIVSGIHNNKIPQEKWLADNEIKLMYCDAIGLPAVFCQSVYVVDGKPSLMVDAMSWLVTHRCPTLEIEIVDGRYSEKECVIRGRRNSNQAWIIVSWDIEKAKTVIRNFYGREGRKTRWETDPKSQLRSRCYSEYYRTNHQKELSGAFYIPEELEDYSETVIEKKPKKPSPPPIPTVPTPPQNQKEYVEDITPEESYDEVEITSTTPLTIDQTVELAKQLISKKKTTKKADVVEKKTLAEMNAKDPLQALEKLTNAPAQPPDTPFMEWIKGLDYKNGWYLVYDAEILCQEGTDYKVKRKLKEAYIETVYVRGNKEGRGLWIAGGWMRAHADDIFNGAVRKVVDI